MHQSSPKHSLGSISWWQPYWHAGSRPVMHPACALTDGTRAGMCATRLPTAFAVLQLSSFTMKERLFVALTWLPKVPADPSIDQRLSHTFPSFCWACPRICSLFASPGCF